MTVSSATVPETSLEIHADTLPMLFRQRVEQTPEACAYREYRPETALWHDISWGEGAARAARMQAALTAENLQRGDRVALMLRNCTDWILFEQAALGLGLTVVPLYTNDRPNNIAYMLQNAGVKLLFIEGPLQLKMLRDILPQLSGLIRLVSQQTMAAMPDLPRLVGLAEWLPSGDHPLQTQELDPHGVATIVYTSGTTGAPKGVMLSHRNILFNVRAALESYPVYRDDLFLSFLPLSHMMERTLGYYIPMQAGAPVAFARSVQTLAEDLQIIRPTILISVPHIYERFHERLQDQLREKTSVARWLFRHTLNSGWRRRQNASAPLWPLFNKLVARKVLNRLGGRLRLAICGGAPMPLSVARTFMSLGMNLLQGYGLTESSPIICGVRQHDPHLGSVGFALNGIEVRLGPQQELWTRSPSVMLGYWNNPQATREVIDSDGWFHTGDQASIEHGRITITGRLKDIIVMSTGKKVAPLEMETAIGTHPWIDQILIVGEGKAFLAALVIVNADHWHALCADNQMDARSDATLHDARLQAIIIKEINAQLSDFPRHARIRRVALGHDPWTVENGLMTPTLKLRRNQILEHYAGVIDTLYAGRSHYPRS